MISRRAFISTLAILAAPLVGEAQQGRKVIRIGVLAPGSPIPDSLPFQVFRALQRGLQALGYVEGESVVLETRWDEGKPERHEKFVRELVQLGVDVIVAGTTPSSVAAKNVTSAIPIVMAATGGDPVALGLAASLSRPGGNVTGLTLQTHELPGKRLELIKETLPRITRVAIFWHPSPISTDEVKTYQVAARRLGVQLQRIEVNGLEHFDGAFQDAVRAQAQAVIMVQSSLYATHRAKIATVAVKAHLPTMSGETGFAEAGGLMNYGPNISDSWRRAAGYVDKILKGAKPGDLPIEQPTKFELVINLKTAKALGLTIPPSILARADQIIQ